MKRVLLLFCLIGAAVSLPVTPAFNAEAADAMSNATLSSHPCVQSTEQDEMHAVVVDMPKIISLSHASPDTWGDLPMSVRPYDQPPDQPPATGPKQQLAMSVSN
jgi:hypothetical protein